MSQGDRGAPESGCLPTTTSVSPIQKNGENPKAEEAYRKAVELDPDCRGRVNLGGVHLLKWEFQRCLEATQKPRDAEARDGAGPLQPRAGLSLPEGRREPHGLQWSGSWSSSGSTRQRITTWRWLSGEGVGRARRSALPEPWPWDSPEAEFLKALEKAENLGATRT